MLFVCLAHFANSYLFVSGADDVGVYVVRVSMLASPTFVTVSGLVAGFLAVTRTSSFTRLRRKLLDRGAFLLLVGHGVLALSGVATGQGFATAYRVGYITDAIGFAVMVGPWLVASVRPRSRLLLAALVFALSWCAVFWWMPHEAIAAGVKHYFIGNQNPGDFTRGNFPLIPWLAVYLAGTVIGERLGNYYVGKKEGRGHLFLARVGIVSIGLAMAVKIGEILFRNSVPVFTQVHPDVVSFLSSYQKFPPGPFYVTFFGGVGIVLVAGILEAGRRGMQPLLLNQLRQIGLASLFIYILEFYLYGVVFRGLRLPYTPLWPVLFLVSIVILAKAAASWNEREGNRYLTVGIDPFLKWNERRRLTLGTGKVRLDAPIT